MPTSFSKPCNPQKESNLFKIPGEIRNKIYSYTFLQYEKPSLRLPVGNCDHIYALHIDDEILQTCQRIYLEARNLLLKDATITYQTYGVVGLRCIEKGQEAKKCKSLDSDLERLIFAPNMPIKECRFYVTTQPAAKISFIMVYEEIVSAIIYLK